MRMAQPPPGKHCQVPFPVPWWCSLFSVHCSRPQIKVLVIWIGLPTVFSLGVLWFPPVVGGREGAGWVHYRDGVVLALRKRMTLFQEDFKPDG